MNNENNKVMNEIVIMLKILIKETNPIITGKEVKDYLALQHHDFLEVTGWSTFPKPIKDTGNIYSSKWGFLSIVHWKNNIDLGIFKPK